MGGKKVRRPKISQEESSRLEELLATDVAALRQFLDDELSEWRSYV